MSEREHPELVVGPVADLLLGQKTAGRPRDIISWPPGLWIGGGATLASQRLSKWSYLLSGEDTLYWGISVDIGVPPVSLSGSTPLLWGTSPKKAKPA